MEVLSARAEVATREADLITAETSIKSNEDALRLLLNISEAESQAIASIMPKDKPTYVARQIDLEEALAPAIQNRADLEISRIGLETDKLNLTYAKNQVLPDLSLSASNRARRNAQSAGAPASSSSRTPPAARPHGRAPAGADGSARAGSRPRASRRATGTATWTAGSSTTTSRSRVP